MGPELALMPRAGESEILILGTRFIPLLLRNKEPCGGWPCISRVLES